MEESGDPCSLLQAEWESAEEASRKEAGLQGRTARGRVWQVESGAKWTYKGGLDFPILLSQWGISK